MSKLSPRKEAWQKRQRRVRRKVVGSGERPRLNIYRSARHIYAQIIDDETNKTVAFVSTLSPDFKAALKDAEAKEAEEAQAAAEAEAAEDEAGEDKKKKKAKKAKPAPKAKIGAAYNVGLLIAQKAQEKGYKKVVFDRNGFLYHGRVKAVADGARKGGLEF